MAIFGSHIGREHTLMGETVHICTLDTLVALLSGLIIFPACFSSGINPGEGVGLIFKTLPHVFNQMPGGPVWASVWGGLFFPL